MEKGLGPIRHCLLRSSAVLAVVSSLFLTTNAMAQCITTPTQTNQVCTNSVSIGELVDNGSVTVTNTAAGTIQGAGSGSAGVAAVVDANVTNMGTISANGENAAGIVAIKTANVTNSGAITATGTQAMGVEGNNVNITNTTTGTITGTFGGVAVGGLSATVPSIVNNFGSISGGGIGIDVLSGSSSGTVSVTNSGTISGPNVGIFSSAGNLVVSNSGSITSGVAPSLAGIAISVSQTVTVNNSATGIISGQNMGIFASVVNITNGGMISAPGNVLNSGNGAISAGGGTIVNSGTISGGIIAANTAITNSGSILGGIQFQGTGSNSLTLQTGSFLDSTAVGMRGASNTLVLQGTGISNNNFANFNQLDVLAGTVWTLGGTDNIIGSTSISGALQVNGLIKGSTLTVNPSGMLSGSGDISATATIASGGMLAPGNAAGPTGTLRITGNLAFQSGALYLVQVTPANSANTNVTGTATLTGSTVQAAFAPGTYVIKSYDILHAIGGLGGTTFSGVTGNLPTDFVASLSYTATDVFLNLDVTLPVAGLGSNQQRVANTVTAFANSGGALAPGFANLFALAPGSLGNALTQLSGETATGSQQTTFDAMGQFMGLLTDPLMARSGGVSLPGATGYADETLGYAATKKTDAFAMFTKAPPTVEQRWSVWAAGFGGSQSTDGNTALGSNNTISNITGTAVGADYLITPTTIAGFALAGGGTSFSVTNSGSGRSDLFQAGAYLRHSDGPVYLSAALAYGWQDITTNRVVTLAGFDQLRAEFNANAWSGRVEGGYRFAVPWSGGFGITPYVAGQLVTFDLPAYAERAISGGNAFALSYNAIEVTDARTELGIRTDQSWAFNGGLLTLRGRFAWAHDFDPDRSIAATFQSLPGASFVVNGAAQAADSALTTASIEMKWKNGWAAAVTFDGEFSGVTRSYAGKGVVRYAW
jgi:uncharacterized protein with beta-barrel porin domain